MDEIETITDEALESLRAAHRTLEKLRQAPYDFGPKRGLALLHMLDHLQGLTDEIESLCEELAANAQPLSNALRLDGQS